MTKQGEDAVSLCSSKKTSLSVEIQKEGVPQLKNSTVQKDLVGVDELRLNTSKHRMQAKQ